MKHLIILLLLASSATTAQNGHYEKIKALKTAYITEQLGLTPQEAEKFWPIYNVFNTQKHSMHRAGRNKVRGAFKNFETLTDAAAAAIIDKTLQFEAKQLANKKEMLRQLRNVISSKKILKLNKAEEDFKRRLLERYRNHRKDNR
ncbi:MAG: sensor of ECF-type sigma factor [Marinirhabdus sp.]